MSSKLTITILLICVVELCLGQQTSAVQFFCPDDWTGATKTPYLKPAVTYFGIFEDKAFQRTSIATRFHGKDSVVQGAYGPQRRMIVDSIRPAFVVSGITLKENTRIPGIHHNDGLFPGESISLHLGTRSWVLYAMGNPIPNSTGHLPFTAIKNYKLILRVADRTKTVEQVLMTMDINAWDTGGYEGGFSIKWIGDLNGDDALDILMAISSHYAGYTNVLYMGIPVGELLVKEVGRYDVSLD